MRLDLSAAGTPLPLPVLLGKLCRRAAFIVGAPEPSFTIKGFSYALTCAQHLTAVGCEFRHPATAEHRPGNRPRVFRILRRTDTVPPFNWPLALHLCVSAVS